jgi:hypothetical protein
VPPRIPSAAQSQETLRIAGKLDGFTFVYSGVVSVEQPPLLVVLEPTTLPIVELGAGKNPLEIVT